MANRVFVSFRNGDEPYAAALLFRALGQRFGPEAVFRSSDSIPPGAEWAATIWHHHALSEAVVVVIGPRWLEMRDSQGRLRLHEEGDWVREEIAEALKQGKLVIPVVLDGIQHLDGRKLPPDIARIAELQAVRMDHRRVDAAVEALVSRIAEVLGSPASAEGEALRAVGMRGAAHPAPGASAAALVPAALVPAVAEDGWLGVWNVPARSRFVVERDPLMAALREAFAGSERAPVVLHGAVGTGKTRLAAEYAHRFAGDFRLAWWIAADQPELIPAQFAALAQATGFGDGQPVEALLPALFARLRQAGRWLLVLDGAEDPASVAPHLADSGADVLVTSRTSHWGTLPVSLLPVPTFARDESLVLLGSRLPGTPPPDLDRLAAALDDIPLAVAQAAEFVAESSITAGRYADLVGARVQELLDRGSTYSYPRSLAAAWSTALEALASAAPEAVPVLAALSVAAAAPVPFRFFDAADSVGWPLASSAFPGDPIAAADAARAIARSGLIPVDGTAFLPNALFQTFLRSRSSLEESDVVRSWVRRVLARAPRCDPRTPEAWSQYSELLPHVFALDVAAEDDPACRALLLASVRHLVARADARTAHTLASSALDRWLPLLGADAADVLDAAAHLAQACFHLGDFAGAVALDDDVLARWRRLAGPDDPRTLDAAHNLAMDRWAAERGPAAARLLDEVAARRRRVLGDGHPDAIRSAHNLALALRETGDLARAHALDAANHARLTAALGPDHPDTLRSAYALALDLRALERHAEALELESGTLERLVAVSGPDHPDTLRSAYGVAVGLHRLGELTQARTTAEDTLERRRKVLGESHADTLRSEYFVGLILGECGEAEQGAVMRERAARGLVALGR